MDNAVFRYEKKYLCRTDQIAIIKNRLDSLLTVDPHCIGGHYNIRSLYLDTFVNQCYTDNEIGVDPRDKFRIRIYNGDRSRIQLEIKRKEHTMTQKTACLLSQEQYDAILSGKTLRLQPDNHPVLNRLISWQYKALLAPAVIVDYDRIPYIYNAGNVRITVDYNIRSGNHFDEFFEKQINGRPILPAGTQLLEVKYTNFIPTYIHQILQTENLEQITFSKYYLCRTMQNSRRIL